LSYAKLTDKNGINIAIQILKPLCFLKLLKSMILRKILYQAN